MCMAIGRLGWEIEGMLPTIRLVLASLFQK
jgi:hypothetical protein